MKLSILITSYQRPHLLKWGLYSLQQQIPNDFEVIVLNDGIPDDTEFICEHFAKQMDIKYIFTGQRNVAGFKWRVPGYAINIGAKRATGNLLMITCSEMYHNSRSNLAHLKDCVIGDPYSLGITKGKDDTGIILKGLEENLDWTVPGTTAVDPSTLTPLPPLNTKLPFAMVLHKDRFFEIGGYDEDFTGIAFDDDDFVNRLLSHGCSYSEVDGVVIHLYHPRGGKARQSEDYRKKWWHNKNLFESRRGIVVRNAGKEWGVMEE